MMDFLPGIPSDGTPEAVAFWISFWAAMYSGILYSIGTGLFVGLAVWFVQLKVEKQRMRNGFDRELAILKERVRAIIHKEDSLNITNAKRSVPVVAQEIMDLLLNYPVDLWLEMLPKRKNFLILLKNIQQSVSEFEISAEKLDTILGNSIRRYNASIDRTGELNASIDISYAIGRIHNSDPDHIIPWINMPLGSKEKLEERYQIVMDNPDLKESSQRYLDCREQILSWIEAIKNELNIKK